VITWDAIIASIVFLFILPLLALILQKPWLLVGYVIDIPALLIPLMAGALPRKELGKALSSLPAFFVLRTVNAAFFLEAVWSEWGRGRALMVYETGH
jgi:hypothetical protein